MMKKISVFWVLAFGLITFFSGCNSSTQDTTTLTGDSNIGTGSVAVLLTDAPIDDFDQFFLTVTEISLLGEDAKVTLFSGNERLNLLDLNSHANLFSLADNIPAGDYHKIRMRVSDPLLVKLDGDGNEVESSIIPTMSSNGKLDLNPRHDLRVIPGQTLAMQIDLDVEKSIHLTQQANGAYRFRPVVFVDILTDNTEGKLMRVSGIIGDSDDYNFELCHTGMSTEDTSNDSDSDSDSDSEHNDDIEDSTDHYDDEYEHNDRCVQILTSSDTSFFDSNGNNITEAKLTEGEPATVLGHFRDSDQYEIGLEAQIVELAQKDVYSQYSGIVHVLDLANNTFTLRDENDALLTVNLDEKTKFFSMTGELLNIDELDIDDVVKVEGVLNDATVTINAAVIFIKVEVPDVSQLTGTISLMHDDLLGFDMTDTSLGDVCVNVDENSNYYLLTIDGDSFSSEEVEYSEFSETQHVEIYGEFTLSGCFMAESILAEEQNPT